jgi:PAS domain S-box-containing protein
MTGYLVGSTKDKSTASSAPMQKLQDGIWIIDSHGETVYANQRMAEILGTSSSEMMG